MPVYPGRMGVTAGNDGITLEISSNNRIVTPQPDEETDLHSSEPTKERSSRDSLEAGDSGQIVRPSSVGLSDGRGDPPGEWVRQDGGAIPEHSLESAVLFVGGNALTNGDEPFELRRKAAFAQRESLVRWAEANGLMVKPSMWEGKAAIGGSEHDIWEETGEYWKVIRPDRFGWTVLPGDGGVPEVSEATPLEYLQRWLHANRLLGDSVKLRGVAATDEGVQVVISQPFIHGPYPEKLQIFHELQSHGFALVPDFSVGSEQDSSFYNDDSRIGIFDAACDNFILSQGLAVPIDVIIVSVGSKLRQQLLARL